jgi:PAS domain S-box-containing protein
MDEILDRAPCGFLSFGDDGVVTEVNATLAGMVGMSRAEVVGRHIDALFTVPSRIFYQTHVYPMLKLHGTVQEVYVSLRHATDDQIPVLLYGSRVQRDGRFVSECVVVPMRQRNEYENELLQARKQAEEATRAKDEFLAVVSHELRAPLSSILGWAHMLSGGKKADPETLSRGMQTIERNARLQAKLIDDILDFARINSGKLRLDVAPLDLTPVVRSTAEGIAPAAAAKSIVLEVSLDPAAGQVMGDSDRIQQVLWNILNNAVKFTPEGGRVAVMLERVDSAAQISVSDNGIGISDEFLPFVFERFRQGDGGSSQRVGGVGLGMSIARYIVELHGGTIEVSSAGAGKGSTFVVRLPLAESSRLESR